MEFALTDEQELLLDGLREAIQRGNYETYFKECDAKGEFPQKAVDDMVANGYAALGIPEEHGGTPVDFLTLCLVSEEAYAQGWPSLCWPNQALAVDDILTFGTPEQQKVVLELALQGKKPFTLGFTEPGAGSDSSAEKTTVTERDGKLYANGIKTFNTGANVSPYMMLVERDFKEEKPYHDMSMWLMRMDQPGVKMSRLDKIGNNMMHTYEVYLDDVELEPSDLMGKRGNGFIQMMKNFEVERILSCAANVGMARCAYEDAAKYAAQRVQFGKTIGSFQLIQEKLTDMKIKCINMENMFHQAAWMKDHGESVSIISSLLKRYSGQAAFEVIDDAMQIMGGIGYCNDCRISRLWRDQRVYRIMAGTEEIMVHSAGRALVKEAAKGI
jgi:crotonobetainyl-CoA dehydrogenase